MSKKLETGRIIIIYSEKYSALSRSTRMKTNSQRDVESVRRKWDKKQTWVKIIRNSLLSFVKILGREKIGRVMVITAGSWYLTCDTWHVTVTGHEGHELPPSVCCGSGHRQAPSDERPSGNLSSKLKKIQTWSESDVKFVHDEECVKCMSAWVFILHYIKVCCWYLVSKRELLKAIWMTRWPYVALGFRVNPLLLKFGEIVPK